MDAESELAQCVWQQLNTLQEIAELLEDQRLHTEGLRAMFLNAFTQLFLTDRHQKRFVQIVLELLQETEDMSLGVDYFADRSASSRRTMSRIFAQRGTSLGELLKYVRFLRFFKLCSGAANATVRPSISTLIYRAGFSDVSNFNHLFKASFGLTPRELMARD
jgi:AraC-like DNA-binding protein